MFQNLQQKLLTSTHFYLFRPKKGTTGSDLNSSHNYDVNADIKMKERLAGCFLEDIENHARLWVDVKILRDHNYSWCQWETDNSQIYI